MGWFQEVTLLGWINSRMKLNWTWGWHLVCELWHHHHRLGDHFCECSHLSLKVNQEGLQPLSTNDFDSAIGDMVLMEGYGTPERKEWEPISYGKNPSRWKPIYLAVTRRSSTIFIPVTDFGAAPIET